MLLDPIADMISRINNANQRKKEKVDIPASGLKENIVKKLKDEGFIVNYKRILDRKQGILRIYLKYSANGERVIRGIQQISKPGLRVYSSFKKFPKIYGGLGILIVSTSKGIMADKEAIRNGFGGELLCKVW